jgi:tRNA (guanosine-2'-O-)-methyltransferase
MMPEREERIRNVLNKRQSNLTVVFENVHDAHNIAAVMRTADAVGIAEIFIIYNQSRNFSKLGKQTSSSASKWLLIHHFSNAAECFAEIRKRYDKILTTKISAESKNVYELDLTQSLALVFGNEHAGVSDECTRLADGNFLIPQVGMIKSLNISVACAVTLYEAYRQRNEKGFYKSPNLAEEMKEQLWKKWMK